MFPVPKSEETTSCQQASGWHPTASLSNLRARARILSQIRQFFAERNILEVETPLLSHGTVTDPHVNGIPAIYQTIGNSKKEICYLQTSPEYAMKRLLAAGSGSIYQICKAFRQGEMGRLHNPEFTMLEWYHLEYDHHALMDEMDLLLQLILGVPPAERITYADLFLKYFNINPHSVDVSELIEIANKNKFQVAAQLDRDAYLDLLWTHGIEPFVAKDKPLFLYDFPISQAALAKIRNEDPPVASRFEVYFKGVELANGFHELQDSDEQIKRFQNDLQFRKQHKLPARPIDERFLAALKVGLPECAGVALGVDRLVMLALEENSLSEIMSFPFERA